jgi:hypothetical protein
MEGAWGADPDISFSAWTDYPPTSTSTSPAEVDSGDDEKVVATTLTKRVRAGDIFLYVANEMGFQVGRVIVLDEGTEKEELAKIGAFGSIIVEKPLKFDHEQGTIIKMLPEASGIGTNTPEPQPTDNSGTQTEVGLATDSANLMQPFYSALALLLYSTLRWVA